MKGKNNSQFLILNSQFIRPGYKQTEVGVIPEDWEVFDLETSARIVDSLHQTPHFSDDGYPMVRVTDIKTGDLDLSETFKVSKSVYEEFIRNYKPKRGDIVLSRVGSYGVSSFVETDEPFCLGQNTVVIHPKVPARLLYYFLNSRGIRQQIEDGSYGSGYKSLSLKNIKELRIPLPPTEDEQRAIAAALSDVDALLDGLDRLIAKKRDLKQAAIQQLLTGKTRLPGFEGEWEVKATGDIADTDPENLSSSTDSNYTFNYIALEDVNRGYLENYSEITYSTAPSRARRRLRNGDILMATVRPNLKAHLLFNGFSGEWVCSTGFCVIRSRQGVSAPEYLMQHLFAHPINKQIEALIAGSNYPAINNKDVRALEIPVPPYKEQTAIAAVLSDMDAEIAALEQRRNKTRDIKQAMMQELLTGKTRLL